MLEHAKKVLGVYKKEGGPKYKLIEKRYNEGEEVGDLETKKRKLQLIRDLHKPLDHKELYEHSIKF